MARSGRKPSFTIVPGPRTEVSTDKRDSVTKKTRTSRTDRSPAERTTKVFQEAKRFSRRRKGIPPEHTRLPSPTRRPRLNRSRKGDQTSTHPRPAPAVSASKESHQSTVIDQVICAQVSPSGVYTTRLPPHDLEDRVRSLIGAHHQSPRLTGAEPRLLRSSPPLSDLVRESLQSAAQSYKDGLVNDIKDLHHHARAISVTAPDYRLIGDKIETLFWKIVDHGYVPVGDMNRIPSGDAGQAKGLMPAISGTTSSSVRPTTTESAPTDGTPRADGKNKTLRWSNLKTKEQRLVLFDHCIIADEYEEDGETRGDQGPQSSSEGRQEIRHSFGRDVLTVDTPADGANDTESQWQEDRQRCFIGNEQLFQVTMMVRILNHHRFEGFRHYLDFTAGVNWQSQHPPRIPMDPPSSTVAIPVSNPRLLCNLSAPRPDLCIGFRPKQLWQGPFYVMHRWLPRYLQDPMIPEKYNTRDSGRAFPFLMFEVKGVAALDAESKATMQAVNDAAHALYNIWRFVHTDPTLSADFFETVMVFTAGGTGSEFWINAHRPMPPTSADSSVTYVYKRIFNVAGNEYTQERVQLVIKKILTWALDTLLPLLRRAVQHVVAAAGGPVMQAPPAASSSPPPPTASDSGNSARDGSVASAASDSLHGQREAGTSKRVARAQKRTRKDDDAGSSKRHARGANSRVDAVANATGASQDMSSVSLTE